MLLNLYFFVSFCLFVLFLLVTVLSLDFWHLVTPWYNIFVLFLTASHEQILLRKVV